MSTRICSRCPPSFKTECEKKQDGSFYDVCALHRKIQAGRLHEIDRSRENEIRVVKAYEHKTKFPNGIIKTNTKKRERTEKDLQKDIQYKSIA